MAERVRRLAHVKSFGPSYGIGGTPANEIGRYDVPVKPISEAMTRKDVLARYETHGLGFKPKPHDDCDDERYGREGEAVA